MRTFCVVVFPPLLDQDLCLAQGVEYFTVEQFIAEPGIEAFAVSVFPRASWLDVSGLCTNGCDPVPNRLRDELGAIIGADVVGHAAQNKQIRENIDDVCRVELAPDPDRQSLPAMLIKNVQGPEGPPVIGAMMHEVVGPNVIAVFRAQTDTRPVVEP